MLNKTLLCVFVAALFACGGAGDAAPAAEFCQAMDDCNALRGQTAEDCAFQIDQCTNDLAPSQFRDWEIAMDNCLQFESCPLVFDCWLNQVPFC